MISDPVRRWLILGIATGLTVSAILTLGNSAATMVNANAIWDEGSGSQLPFTWDHSNFDGFNVSGIRTESLSIVQTDLGAGKTRTINRSGLIYTTALQPEQYEVSKNKGLQVERALGSSLIKSTSGRYYAAINLFGETYAGLNGKPDRLSKLLFKQEASEQKILTVGETWDTGGGWMLSAQAIDAKANPKQVWLVLSKNGIKKDDKVLAQGQVYTYVEKNVSGESDVPLFVTYIDSIFAGAQTDVVRLKYTWVISDNAIEVKAGDSYGVFTVASVSGSGLKFGNDQKVILSPNATISLAGNIKLKVFDDSAYLKFYPVKESGAAISEPVVITSMGDAIKAVNDYFMGIITKDEAVGKVTTVIMPVPAPTYTPDYIQPENITKLEILPSYGNTRLQPGESKGMVVTVRNKENKAFSLSPKVVIPPYSEHAMEKEWIAVTPETVEIPAGGSQRFTVNVSVPKNASTGYYSGQIIFTDEVIPAPYPEPYPNYIHYMSLSIEVWAQPRIQILTPYISDQIEAGKEYNYEIKLKNTAGTAISINPIVGSDTYYGGPYGTSPALTDDAITITAPQNIPANTTETVKVHVSVPADSRGYYSGWIDLGIDDPSIREGEGRVSLNFNIWKQPVVPFVKNFSVKEASSVTIEVTSSSYSSYPYPVPVSGQTITAKEPSFEVSLEGDAGTVTLNLTKTLIKGRISMGEPKQLAQSTDTYQETDTQHIETYKANISAGDWKLKVLPRNTQSFEYTITIG